MFKLSIVIPVFNESTLIKELIMQVIFYAEKTTQDFEVIIVDDGSLDETWKEISRQVKIDKRIKGIKLSRNFGHHYAITAGLDYSSGDWVVVMDGDLQDRPEVIPQLYNKAQEGYDIVFVSRKNRPEKIHYKIIQKIFYQVLRLLSGVDFDSSQANFSIINKKVVKAFKLFPENARFYGSTIKWLGFKRNQIFADHGIRYSGKPAYTLKKRIRLASDMIVSFSDRPLKFAIGLGTFLSMVSLTFTVVVISRFIFLGNQISGITAILSAIFLSTGIVLIVLGISSIYIAEIFREVKKRPLYIIDEVI